MRTTSLEQHAIDPIISLRDVAALLGIHPDTVKNRARAGKLKLIRVSERRLGVRQSEFQRYVNAGEALCE